MSELVARGSARSHLHEETARRDSIPDRETVSFLSHAYARDASHFLRVPKQVHFPDSVEELVRLFHMAKDTRQPITFRSGGSSLSGQGVTRATLLDTRMHFGGARVLDEGRRIYVEPGVTIRYANALLQRYHSRLGPDPASEIACTMGGALANNSSGMTCGTEFNAYKTLESMVFVLPSGTVLDTSAPDARDRLRVEVPEIHSGLLSLRDRIRSSPHSVSEIERLFSIKNTMGYSVNAFIDFYDPVDILCHLMIGSEGTLGFIASAVLRTVPIPGFTSTALAVFPSLAIASGELPDLTCTRCRAIELMDAREIRVASQATDASELLPALDLGSEAVLLFEIAGESPGELRSNVADVESVIARSRAARFSVAPNAASESRIWRARKGLYALVAGARPQGTSALLEDVAVPMHRLAQTCSGLSNLLEEFHYRDSIMFGHARDGNLHFLLSENFASSSGLDRYARFTERLVDLVLDNGGTLKAEHGTGRVRAPYLERQYGPELLSVMVDVKRLIDPHGILNPDEIVSQDPTIHLKDLKTTPPVEEVVDRCVDCGFCEPVCPSRKFTTTPRQRIAIRRAMSLARESGNTELLEALEAQSSHEVVDSCAVDGMCSTVCPLGINTGTLVEQLRQERSSKAEQRLGVWGANHWGLTTALVSFGITVSQRIPRLTSRLATKARLVTSSSKIPLVDEDLPRGGHRRRSARADNPDIIYLPSCMNTLFSAPENSMGVNRAFLALCREAGISVRIPIGIDDLCCGTPWKSKGLDRGYRRMREAVCSAMVRETRRGEVPFVTDASSCTEGFIKSLEGFHLPPDRNIRVFDVVSFTVNELMPRLPKVERKFDSLALHPTCSIIRLGLEQDLKNLASEVAHATITPHAWGCCAFAGDRGLLVPGLTQSATEAQAQQIESEQSQIHASCNQTCEIGMSLATGATYGHIIEYLALALGLDVYNYNEGERS